MKSRFEFLGTRYPWIRVYDQLWIILTPGRRLYDISSPHLTYIQPLPILCGLNRKLNSRLPLTFSLDVQSLNFLDETSHYGP
jgi:hypothetical protein